MVATIETHSRSKVSMVTTVGYTQKLGHGLTLVILCVYSVAMKAE